MLYKKNGSKKLDLELFKKPTSEYRAAPFWAWNCKLEQKELEWQLEIFKKMGLGGAHMHVRTGMATEYLSDEHMSLIKACVDKAKSEGMLAWLYDEDRWPSGPAGGIVTKDHQYRARYLLFTPFPYGSEEAEIKPTLNSGSVVPGRTEIGKLVACYDVELDEKGYLVSWKVIGENEEATHDKWYAYLEEMGEISWWNGQTYVNTLDKAAMDRFIDVTYESYNRTVADEFDKTVPAIFTDEPQFPRKSTLSFATEKKDVTIAWTDDLPETFAAAYGEDLVAGVPELIWERADKQVSVLRYHYHDHVCERFATAFVDNCGTWCEEHGLKLTGHVMEEPTLMSQTAALGEAMRTYRKFGIPGIDMLCSRFEYTTAKQTQSAVHQFNREAMLSELYGVTGWDFDFRGHKLHGDWQAALGVTIRVPHLSWVSMGGEAKRDYPASIHYQSPWWEKYSLVEDHFARVNTALTRGKPLVKVGVIHPIESYWLHWGPAEQTAVVRDNLDQNFQNITEWLLMGGVDFDFICESLLPDLCEKGGAPFKVGAMEYDMILVPGCETLRSSTLERLEAFAAAGGQLVFVGDVPTLENAIPSERGKKLAEQAQRVQFNKGSVLEAVEPVRFIELRNQSGAMTTSLLHQLRQDGDGRWLFIASGKEPYNKHVSRKRDLTVRIKGQWKASLYNTFNGEVEEIEQQINGNVTEVYYPMYHYDSLLIWLEPIENTEEQATNVKANVCKKETKAIRIPDTVDYTLTEPNVLLLDQAEYALDGGEWHEREEILKLDVECRKMLGWATDIGHVAQPWSLPEDTEIHNVTLRWKIQSEVACEGIKLAIEHAKDVTLKWNGADVDKVVDGWYVDKAIQTIPLPALQKGENVLEAIVPIGNRTMVEWAYLLGDFGVEVIGKNARIVEKREQIAFGSIVNQGLPFYTGNITYHIPVETNGGNIKMCSSYYVGGMQEAGIDGKEAVPMIYQPYTVTFADVKPGKHVIDLKLYGTRQNGFGPVHLADDAEPYQGPRVWRKPGDQWSYEYRLREAGVIVSPRLEEEI